MCGINDLGACRKSQSGSARLAMRRLAGLYSWVECTIEAFCALSAIIWSEILNKPSGWRGCKIGQPLVCFCSHILNEFPIVYSSVLHQFRLRKMAQNGVCFLWAFAQLGPRRIVERCSTLQGSPYVTREQFPEERQKQDLWQFVQRCVCVWRHLPGLR